MGKLDISVPRETPATGPAMYAVIGLTSGIVAGTALPTELHITGIIAAMCILAALFLRRHERAADTAVLSALAAAGMMSVAVSDSINRPLPLPVEYLNSTVAITGTIVSEPRFYSTDAAVVIVDADSMSAGGSTAGVQGRIPVSIYRRTGNLAEGARISVRGTVKRYRATAASSPYTHRIVVGAGDDNEAVVTEPAASPAARMRADISALIDRHEFGGQREIVRAITIGDRSALPRDTSSIFAQSGIAHVLAVSGLHAGIVMIAFGTLLSFLPIGRAIRVLLTGAVLIGYAAICGFRPPVLRAAIMLGLLTIAPLFGRTGQRENSLAVALILILAIDPPSLFGPSLQLSFVAVWGIITFHRPLMQWISGERRLPQIIWIPVSAALVSGIAFVLTAPIAAAHFGTIALFSLLINLPAVFIIISVVPLSWIAIISTAAGSFGAPVATVAAYFCGLLLQLLDAMAHTVASLPHASLETPVPGIAALLLFAGLFAFSRRAVNPLFLKASIFLPMIALLVIAWEPAARARIHANGGGDVVFFDVGQGDAALVEYPGGRCFLIDAGPAYGRYDSGSAIIAPYLERTGITRLSGVFISHCHEDHTGGIGAILASVAVDAVYCRADIADSLASVFMRPVTGIAAGDSIAVPGGGILVMAPRAGEPLAENDASLLLRFTMGQSHILFTGDIEEDRQHLLSAWRERLAANVLKAPHHGGSIDESFLGIVHPAAMVISCGADNSYGHPAPEVVTRASEAGSALIRTDRDGTIRIDFPSLTVRPY